MVNGPPGHVVPAVLVASRAKIGSAGLGRGSGVGQGDAALGSTAEVAQDGLMRMLVRVTDSMAAWAPKELFTNWTSAGRSCWPTVTGLVNAGVTLMPRPAICADTRFGTSVTARASTATARLAT
jgi:hypothetical protein